MGSRARWFVSNIGPNTLRTLGDSMLGDQFRQGGSSGFRMRHVRPDLLEGSFIELIESTEMLEDPFGKTQELKWSEYRQTAFRITTTTPSIEIFEPFRTHRSLLDRIWDYSQGSIYIEPARIRVIDWLGKIESEIGRVTVTTVKASDLTISNTVSAKIELTGSSDVRRHLTALSGARPIKIDRAEFRFKIAPDEYCCEISSEGKATVHSGLPSRAFAILRSCLTLSLPLQARTRTTV